MLIFKNRSSARTNRIFLLLGLTVPFTLPLVSWSTAVDLPQEAILLPAINVQLQNVEQVVSNSNQLLAIGLYLLGFIAFAMYQFNGVIVFLRLKNRAIHEGNKVYRFQDVIMPFSFFGSIFLPSNLSKEQEETIVAHEQWHIQLKHSWDVLLAAVVQTVLWFFPIMPFYVRALRNEHEYEVDERMLQHAEFDQYAETLLHVSLMPIQHVKFHSFSAPTLKKRLIMMTRTQKNNTWKLLTLLPLIGSLIYLSACTKNAEAMPQQPEAMSLQEVSTPPQFTGCETNESKQAQMQCFMQGLTEVVVANFKYPKEASAANKTGKTMVEFVITKEGELKNARVAKGVEYTNEDQHLAELMDDAALAVFDDFPKVIPAKKDGKTVSVKYIVPIQFALK
jgi:TonB family protein